MNGKGFTLVELLAVLIILSVIITIVILSVQPIISESKDELLVNQKHNIEEAAKIYYLKGGDLDATSSCVNVETLINKDYIEATEVLSPIDNEPMNGSVQITYLANQYKYEYSDNACIKTCRAVTAETKSLSGTIPTGEYNSGEEYICDVNETTSYHFYVLGTDGDNVNLIIDRNYTDDFVPVTMSWCISGNNNSCNHDNLDQYIEHIEELWTNVDSVDLPTANQIAHAVGNTTWDGSTWFFFDSKNQSQTATSKGESNYAWLFDYTYNCESDGCNVADSSNAGHWTASPSPVSSNVAWIVDYGGDLAGDGCVDYSTTFGLRPVITVPKSYIES